MDRRVLGPRSVRVRPTLLAAAAAAVAFVALFPIHAWAQG